MLSFAQAAIGGEGGVDRRAFTERKVVPNIGLRERTRVLQGSGVAVGERRGGIIVWEEQRGRGVNDAHRIGAMTIRWKVSTQTSRSHWWAKGIVLRVPSSRRLVPHLGSAGIG